MPILSPQTNSVIEKKILNFIEPTDHDNPALGVDLTFLKFIDGAFMYLWEKNKDTFLYDLGHEWAWLIIHLDHFCKWVNIIENWPF